MSLHVAHDPCPSDDTLGALVEGMLAGEVAERVRAHLDGCGTCRASVIAAVRSETARRVAPAQGGAGSAAAARAGIYIGRYELGPLLGTGGMGAVYEAHDPELDRPVALKLLRAALGVRAPELTQRLVRESQLMAKVRHPAVVTVYDVGRDDDAVFIAMELVRGTTLTAWLAQAPRGWRAIVEQFERTGRGLAAAHDAGIVHRDFKPDNVLVEQGSGRVVVTDFGVAAASATAADPPPPGTESDRAGAPPPRLTAHGYLIGTLAYMAPEQLDGEPVDRSADVFAFSVALWEALCGARPFPGRTPASVRAAMRAGPPVVPAGPARKLPRRLIRVLRRGLAIDRRERWPALPPLLAELAALRHRRRRAALAGAAIAAAAAVAAIALTLSPAPRPPGPTVCARAPSALAAGYGSVQVAQLTALLSPDRDALGKVMHTLDDAAARWRETHARTCDATRPVPQDPLVTACLDARRHEIVSYVEDTLAAGAAEARWASLHVNLLASFDASACAHPTAGMLHARVPAEAAQRRAVRQLRARMFEVEDMYLHGDGAGAIAAAEAVVRDAGDAWPSARATATYVLGMAQNMRGDSERAVTTLHEAVTQAERAQDDVIAASAWIALASIAVTDHPDLPRALDHLAAATAALDRAGRPRPLVPGYEYVRGTVLLAAGRKSEAEQALRAALDRAGDADPPTAIALLDGLATLYEGQGRYADAVEVYRAVTRNLATHPAPVADAATRGALALALALLGHTAEATAAAREVVAETDAALADTHIERPLAHALLAETLARNGDLDAALAESDGVLAAIARIQGERSAHYAIQLRLYGERLARAGRAADALRRIERACEITAFVAGERSDDAADCEIARGATLTTLGRARDALPRLDRAIAVLSDVRGPAHPSVGAALTLRAAAHAALGATARAIADDARAIELLSALQLDPGYEATARGQLAGAVWASDPARARAELVHAERLFARAAPWWTREREAIAAVRARHARDLAAQ